eukprot:1336557-Amphidinium_carterae.1
MNGAAECPTGCARRCYKLLPVEVGDRLEKRTKNMTTFTTRCKDPAAHAKYPACQPVCHDTRLSVQFFGT